MTVPPPESGEPDPAQKVRPRKTKAALQNLPIVPDAEPKPTGEQPLVTSHDEREFYAHRLREREMDIGWLGKFFGTWWTPAMIVAAFVAALIVVLWVITLAFDRADMADARKYLFSGLLSVVAYIFGAATKLKGGKGSKRGRRQR